MHKLSRLRTTGTARPIPTVTQQHSTFDKNKAKPTDDSNDVADALRSMLATASTSSSTPATSTALTKEDTIHSDQGHQLISPGQGKASTSRPHFSRPIADGNVGCIEALARALASGSCGNKSGKSITKKIKQNNSFGAAAAPPIFQSSKGTGTVECRDSVRALLRFFGHAPLLHIEGIIWVKTSGERVHCIAALSNWSLFLVPLRNPWSVGGLVHGLQGNQKTSSRIIEVPLGSILHVSMVSARENLDTFASHEDNWVSRPFRLVTCNRSEATNSRDDPEVGENGGVGLITRGENILTVVAFEAVSRLRYMLVLAREGWSIRTSVDSITLEMTTSATRTATRYLADIHQAMTGAIRDQDDAQVDLMENLADELVLDAAVKQAFFSASDVFFDIARWLQEIAQTAEAADATVTADDKNGSFQDGGSGGRESRRNVVVKAHHFSAVASVLDSAFFHSLEVPGRVELVARQMPASLPVVADLLVTVYSCLRRRLFWSFCDGGEEELGLDSYNEDLKVSSAVAYRNGGEDVETSGVEGLQDLLIRMADCVVGALNGMGEVVRLFNIEHEHLGLVRNLVSVSLGRDYRASIQPSSSDALSFLVMVTDRMVGLIEALDRKEQKQRELACLQEEEREKRRAAEAAFHSVASTAPRKRKSFFSRLRSRSTAAPNISNPSTWRDDGDSQRRVSFDGDCGLRQLPVVNSDAERGEKPNVQMVQDEKLGSGLRNAGTARCGQTLEGCQVPSVVRSRDLLSSPPVLLYSYAKLLQALVCGSYDMRAAFLSMCEAELRNIGRQGGYLDVLAGLDGSAPRMVYRETSRYLLEILDECAM